MLALTKNGWKCYFYKNTTYGFVPISGRIEVRLNSLNIRSEI